MRIRELGQTVGVDVQTILRNHSELLTRQSTAAASVDAGDTVRRDRLRQLQEVFSGGPSGIGASINDMMNALSDVVSSPTDLTARSVALTRMDETAARMRDASQRLDEIGYTVAEQLKGSMVAVNSLARNIAAVNEQIARAKGNGQSPNDLLDRRDQLIRELNQYIQTTQIPADDGSIGVFIGGSQALHAFFAGDPLIAKLRELAQRLRDVGQQRRRAEHLPHLLDRLEADLDGGHAQHPRAVADRMRDEIARLVGACTDGEMPPDLA